MYRLVRLPIAFLLTMLMVQPACAQRDSVAAALPRLGGLSAALLAGERAVNEPHKLIIYLDEAGQRVPTAAQAVRRVEVSFRDSVSGSVRVYYPSGKLYRSTPFAHLRLGLRHGVETTWSEDGKRLTSQDFVGGRQQGEFYAYFGDGTVARHLHFEHDRLQSIECFGRDGQPRSCQVREELPEYPGGWESLGADLMRGFVYPPADLQASRGGKVMLLLDVDAAGQLQGAHLRNCPSETLRSALLEGVSKLRKFRHPGTQDDVPVAVQVLLSVELEVKKSGRGGARVSTFPVGVFPSFQPGQ